MTPPYNCITNVLTTADVDSWFPSTVIPVVADDTARDAMFPSPITNQRVENLDSGIYELWNGSNWVPDVYLASTLGNPSGADVIGFVQSGLTAEPRTSLDKMRETVTPLDFMDATLRQDVISGDSDLDHTDALHNMFASGAKVFNLLGYRYNVSIPEGTTLAAWSGVAGIRVLGYGAWLLDCHTYTTGSITAFFDFDACSDVVVDINYEGTPIGDKSNPDTGIGYRGATIVYLRNGCSNVTTNGEWKYYRYGCLSGAYAAPAYGYNKKLSHNILSFEGGYPIAHYLAEDVEFNIYAESSHRAAYLAGVKGLRGTARVKDQYIAPIQVLLSDAMTGTGTSRGCSDVDISVQDMGSTIFVANSWIAGISLSRVDPDTVYENIRICVTLTGTDDIATTVGGFALYSNAKAVPLAPYPYNWEPTIYLRNIIVSGVIDRSLQTVATHGTGEIYTYTLDGLASAGHYATVSGLRFDNLRVIQGTGSNPRSLFFTHPGVTDCVNFTGCDFGNYTLECTTAPNNKPFNFINCAPITKTNGSSGDTSAVNFVNTDVTAGSQPLANTTFNNSRYFGVGFVPKVTDPANYVSSWRADNTNLGVYFGLASPEGSITAPAGSIFLRRNSGGATIYRKASGIGNSGWVSMTPVLGNGTLAAGAATVADTTIATGDLIILARTSQGTLPGILSYAITNGVGFSVASSSNTDDGTFSYQIIKP